MVYSNSILLINMSDKIQVDTFFPSYPEQPGYRPQCGINQTYQTVKPNQAWEYVAAGPTTIKHLYTGIPNYYPYRKILKPVNSLYGASPRYETFHQNGVGVGKRRSYNYKIYPLTDRYVREDQEYADYLLPYMDTTQWIKHPIRRDASVNSDLQKQPYPYDPTDW